MKKLLLFALPLAGACVSVMPVQDRVKEYIVQTEGVSADTAYDRATVWFATTFQDSRAVLVLQDKGQRRLIGNGWMKCRSQPIGVSDWGGEKLKFKIDFQSKDGRIRIVFTDLESWQTTGGERLVGPRHAEDIGTLSTNCLDPITKTLVDAVKGSSAPTKDW